jgi:hypothetical protein
LNSAVADATWEDIRHQSRGLKPTAKFNAPLTRRKTKDSTGVWQEGMTCPEKNENQLRRNEEHEGFFSVLLRALRFFAVDFQRSFHVAMSDALKL